MRKKSQYGCLIKAWHIVPLLKFEPSTAFQNWRESARLPKILTNMAQVMWMQVKVVLAEVANATSKPQPLSGYKPCDALLNQHTMLLNNTSVWHWPKTQLAKRLSSKLPCSLFPQEYVSEWKILPRNLQTDRQTDISTFLITLLRQCLISPKHGNYNGVYIITKVWWQHYNDKYKWWSELHKQDWSGNYIFVGCF